MDGTLVDTEPYWIAAETELVESHGGVWTHEDGLALVGTRCWRAPTALQERGVDLAADEIVDFLNGRVVARGRGRDPVAAGRPQLLAELHDAGVPMRAGDLVVPDAGRPFAACRAGLFDAW